MRRSHEEDGDTTTAKSTTAGSGFAIGNGRFRAPVVGLGSGSGFGSSIQGFGASGSKGFSPTPGGFGSTAPTFGTSNGGFGANSLGSKSSGGGFGGIPNGFGGASASFGATTGGPGNLRTTPTPFGSRAETVNFAPTHKSIEARNESFPSRSILPFAPSSAGSSASFLSNFHLCSRAHVSSFSIFWLQSILSTVFCSYLNTLSSLFGRSRFCRTSFKIAATDRPREAQQG